MRLSLKALLPSLVVVTLALAAPLASQERTTVGGYGEIHYHNDSGASGFANVRRFVLYVAHSFDDRLSFRSELELEDAKVEPGHAGGEVALEQAYLDYRIESWLTLRSGLLLVPVGTLNEVHEPPTFNGVERPDFDHDVIPTTWREIGVGAVGRIPGEAGLSYRLYLLNGLDAGGFSGDEGIRGGRGEGQNASFANPSLTGRLEWARPGLKVGGAFWYGGTANGIAGLGSGAFSAPVTVLALDAQYAIGALALRAEAANVYVRDANLIDQLLGSEVGSRIAGGYVEAAYDLLRHLDPDGNQRLSAFVRHERFDTQANTPATVVRDRALARRITTFGLTYKPTWNTAFKGDYQLFRNAAGADEHQMFSLGVGYQF
jgi:hypothetical protein